MNFGDEGTNASHDMSTFYLPQIGAGRYIRIDYRPEDGWKVDTDGCAMYWLFRLLH